MCWVVNPRPHGFLSLIHDKLLAPLGCAAPSLRSHWRRRKPGRRERAVVYTPALMPRSRHFCSSCSFVSNKPFRGGQSRLKNVQKSVRRVDCVCSASDLSAGAGFGATRRPGQTGYSGETEALTAEHRWAETSCTRTHARTIQAQLMAVHALIERLVDCTYAHIYQQEKKNFYGIGDDLHL